MFTRGDKGTSEGKGESHRAISAYVDQKRISHFSSKGLRRPPASITAPATTSSSFLLLLGTPPALIFFTTLGVVFALSSSLSLHPLDLGWVAVAVAVTLRWKGTARAERSLVVGW